MRNFVSYLFVFILFLVGLGTQCLFIVQEGQKAMLLRLGSLRQHAQHQVQIYEPGLHFKIPFIESPYYLDSRYQLWVTDSDRVQTVEQLYLLVDFYVQWQVSDYAVFFRANAASGQRTWPDAKRHVEILLKQKVRNAVLEQFGHRSLSRLISEDRKEIMRTFADIISPSLEGLGIRLIDFRLKKIELPDDVSEKIYNRMKTERQKSAAIHRARGLERSEKIRAQTDYEAQYMQTQAASDALKMRGEADATASKIYANVFSKYPHFYNFYESLKSYEEIFKPGDQVILSTQSTLFDHFQQREKS